MEIVRDEQYGGRILWVTFKTWIENHTTWRSSATHRSVIAIVPAAFICYT